MVMLLFLFPVCEKYLCQYPEHKELLWEVESVGEPNQRTNLFCKIQSMDLSGKMKARKDQIDKLPQIIPILQKRGSWFDLCLI